MSDRRVRRRRGAFTMVEVIVVVIVIAVLATLITPRFFRQVGRAKAAVTQQNIAVIEQSIDRFHYEFGRFPASLDELVNKPTDVDGDKWSPFIKAKELVDPWGRPYLYRIPGEHGEYDLYSLGADGQEGGTGENADVHNW